MYKVSYSGPYFVVLFKYSVLELLRSFRSPGNVSGIPAHKANAVAINISNNGGGFCWHLFMLKISSR